MFSSSKEHVVIDIRTIFLPAAAACAVMVSSKNNGVIGNSWIIPGFIDRATRELYTTIQFRAI
tara:strand:- start:744 stop:932 length:189 start_codon:yes stop_codon:yes gene_type:complete